MSFTYFNLVFRFLRDYVGQFLLVALVFLVSSYLIKIRKLSQRLPPGPIGLPFVGYLPFLGKEHHKTFLKLSKKYGNLFSLRIGKNLTIVLNDWKSMKEVYSHPSTLDKPNETFNFIPHVGIESFNGDEWEEQRRYCVQSLKELGLGRGPWEKLIWDEVIDFLDYLRFHDGQPLNIDKQISSSISSNIMSLLIGRKLEKETEEDKINLSVEYANKLFLSTSPSGPASVIPGLRKCLEFFRGTGHYDIMKIVTNFFTFLREEIEKHKSSTDQEEQRDFVGMYLNKMREMSNKNKKHFFTNENLIGNANILFLGASDTIISSMKWVYRLMAAHPKVQKKVQQELDELIGEDGQITYADREKIPYTFSVILESQRFSSIAVVPQARGAREDFEVQGFVIPKGSRILTNLYALHNDEHYWDHPEVFMPERFLSEDGKKVFHNLPSFAPFSTGRRKCPGEIVAWMEILAFFTGVMQKYEISLEEGVTANFDCHPGLVSHLKPQKLIFTVRRYTK